MTVYIRTNDSENPLYSVEQISIPFTREEWARIANTLLEYGYNDERLNDDDYIMLNIIDRIEKNLGVE